MTLYKLSYILKIKKEIALKVNILVISFFTILLLASCSSKNSVEKNSYKNQIKLLQSEIELISKTISSKEAHALAKISISHSLYLKKSYSLLSPPLYHNTLINLGLKERGFCYHFTHDLLKELKKYNFKTLDLRWAVHKRGEYFEHNSILVSAKNKDFFSGIILDAWRNSGILFWENVKKDKDYTWSENIEKSKFFGTIKEF